MKLKFYSKWVLLVCFVFFQHASLWSQTSFDPITLENTSFNIYSDFRYLYIAGDENPISIREPNDLKIAFSKNIVTSRGKFEDSIYYPSFSYNIPKKKVRISNLSLGYSPLPHLYGIANFSLLNEKDVSSSAITNMIIGDIGIGTYFLKKANSRPFLKEKFQFKKLAKLKMTSRGLLINALVGYSRGRINYTPSYKVGLGQFILNRIYGKVGFDYQAGFFGIATDAKIGILNYGTTTIVGHAYDDLTAQSALLVKENDFMFNEFSFRFYVGMKFGQIYINGITTKVNNKMEDFILSDFWSVGTVLDIQEIFKKKNKEL